MQIRNNQNIWLLLASIVLGILSVFASSTIGSSLADPLVIALIFGMIAGGVFNKYIKTEGLYLATKILIPIGIVLYGFRNLNFHSVVEIGWENFIVIIVIILTYFFSVLLMGKIFNQKKKITYLVATGSAICGASAITVTAPSVDAEPDDISISLFAVLIAAVLGLFIFIPFLSVLFAFSVSTYSNLSGAILQFTGFVKTSINYIPPLVADIELSSALDLALSVKAIRYLGLLISIPLFASLLKKKLYFPWFLWFFVFAGILGTYLRQHEFFLESFFLVKQIYTYTWAIALTVVGLSVDSRNLFSNNGGKAIAMAIIGMCLAMAVFFISQSLIII